MSIPTTDEEFVAWAKESLGTDFNDADRRHYDLNSSRSLLTVQNHPFFVGLRERLTRLNDEYRAAKRADLLMSSPDVQLYQKSFSSVVNKAFRQNIVWNKNFPAPPTGGWIKPDNVAQRFDDLIRGTIVCKYIDQPRWLAERLTAYASELALSSRYSSKGHDNGYYAYHFHVDIPLSWVDKSFAEISVLFPVELQLTTQLQEILYDITHEFYQDRRLHRVDDQHAWKWEFSTSRFRAGYLSHTLHLLEAIVLDLRDSRRVIAEAELDHPTNEVADEQ